MSVAANHHERGLIALWDHVLEHWDEDAAHQALLEAADAQENLAFAAKRYRRKVEEGVSAQVAEAQLAKITVLALSRMEATRSETPNSKRTVTLLALGVSFMLILASTYMISR